MAVLRTSRSGSGAGSSSPKVHGERAAAGGLLGLGGVSRARLTVIGEAVVATGVILGLLNLVQVKVERVDVAAPAGEGALGDGDGGLGAGAAAAAFRGGGAAAAMLHGTGHLDAGGTSNDTAMQQTRSQPAFVLCEDPTDISALVAAAYCETGQETALLNGLVGLPERIQTPAAHGAVRGARRLQQDARDVAGVEKEADAGPPLTGEVFVHASNVHLFGRGLKDAVKEKPQLIPAGPAEALDGLTWRSCALVGNSGILRKTAYGAAIDSHDAVLRINQAPAQGGCPLYVGARTTVRMLNAHWLHKFGHESMQRLPLERNVTLLVTRYDPDDYGKVVEHLQRVRPDIRVRLLTRDVMHGSQQLLRSFRRRVLKGTAYQGVDMGDNPSSGLLAVYTMLQLCDKVSLYGFGLHHEKERHVHDRQLWYHYFRHVYGKRAMDSTHSFDTERLLLQSLGMSGKLTLCSFREPGASGTDVFSTRLERKLARGRNKRGGGAAAAALEEQQAAEQATPQQAAQREAAGANIDPRLQAQLNQLLQLQQQRQAQQMLLQQLAAQQQPQQAAAAAGAAQQGAAGAGGEQSAALDAVSDAKDGRQARRARRRSRRESAGADAAAGAEVGPVATSVAEGA